MYLLAPFDEFYCHLLPSSQVHSELDEPKRPFVQIPYLSCHRRCVRQERHCCSSQVPQGKRQETLHRANLKISAFHLLILGMIFERLEHRRWIVFYVHKLRPGEAG